MQLGKLGSHLCTQLSVQVGQRLVEKEYLRITNDRTTQCNTLSLTAGESLRLSVEQVSDVEDLSSFLNELLDLVLGNLTELQTERHIVKYCHMRIQSVVLENHRDISVLRSNVVYKTFADEQLALGNFLKTRDHTKGGGLTASGRTYKNDKFLVLDVYVDVGYCHNAAGVALVYASE